MRTSTKSKTTRFLERLAGGPLTLGRLVAAIRLGEQTSLTEFAETLGISRSHLCDIEKGRKPVSAAKAAEMARTLGYDEKQFIQLAMQDSLRRAGLHYGVKIEAA